MLKMYLQNIISTPISQVFRVMNSEDRGAEVFNAGKASEWLDDKLHSVFIFDEKIEDIDLGGDLNDTDDEFDTPKFGKIGKSYGRYYYSVHGDNYYQGDTGTFNEAVKNVVEYLASDFR